MDTPTEKSDVATLDVPISEGAFVRVPMVAVLARLRESLGVKEVEIASLKVSVEMQAQQITMLQEQHANLLLASGPTDPQATPLAAAAP